MQSRVILTVMSSLDNSFSRNPSGNNRHNIYTDDLNKEPGCIIYTNAHLNVEGGNRLRKQPILVKWHKRAIYECMK